MSVMVFLSEEKDLFQCVQVGSEDVFVCFVEFYCGELQVYCYWMFGLVYDVEDLF